MKPLLHFSVPFLAMGYLLSAAPGNAHPGHGPNELLPVHYFVSPDHLGMALVAGVILFCAWRSRRMPENRPGMRGSQAALPSRFLRSRRERARSTSQPISPSLSP